MKEKIYKTVLYLIIISALLFSKKQVLAAGREPEPVYESKEQLFTTKGGETVYGETPVYGEPVYGGGVIVPRVDMMVDKKVRNPATGEYVDHLSPVDPKYRAQEIISFKILVKNPGEEMLDQIAVKDVFPKVLGQVVVDFMSGPGDYDTASNTLSFNVTNLAPGETQTFVIKGRIVHSALLPGGKNIICPEPGNVVEASSVKLTDRDEAGFCIVKEMEKEVPAQPEAGPEHWLVSLMGLATAFITGRKLRKNHI